MWGMLPLRSKDRPGCLFWWADTLRELLLMERLLAAAAHMLQLWLWGRL